MTVTFLGTGTSHGIPVIGCHCPVCRSSDAHDKRFRCSILISEGNRRLLVDTGPELRLQCLRAGIDAIDAVFYTHDHADHFNGIDDLRIFCNDRQLPVYCSSAVAQGIRTRFPYVLRTCNEAGGIPHLTPRVVSPYVKTEMAGFSVEALPIMHGLQMIYALKIGSFIYATDCSGVPESSMPYFMDIDTLVIGALRHTPHPTHFSVEQAVSFASSCRARHVYLTHMSHDLGHRMLEKELPSHMHPAYDMLTLTTGDTP